MILVSTVVGLKKEVDTSVAVVIWVSVPVIPVVAVVVLVILKGISNLVPLADCVEVSVIKAKIYQDLYDCMLMG